MSEEDPPIKPIAEVLAEVNANTTAELLASHYHKTYELTYEFWKQRNRTFLLLIGVIGVATLLTFRPADTQPLLLYWIANFLGVTETQSIEELRNSFPFGILQSIFLIVVFYLMFNLYHRALYVLRSYAYLEALEPEIRQCLGLAATDKSFTREGEFYWKDRPPLLGAVKWFYYLLLGGLLIAFLGGRIVGDINTGNYLLAGVDSLIAIPTMVFFFGYATSSASQDRPPTTNP